jgi:hypothetical protein
MYTYFGHYYVSQLSSTYLQSQTGFFLAQLHPTHKAKQPHSKSGKQFILTTKLQIIKSLRPSSEVVFVPRLLYAKHQQH